ncbi:MAG TPA: autotransporter-associated beta strand repeat-containing protein [Verrucomicrobiae bacterium]
MNPLRSFFKISRGFAALALASSFLTPPTHAANRTWSGGGADNNWSTALNWGGTAPVNNDNLIFNGTTQQNNTNNIASLAVGFINFNNNGFVLNGNALTMAGSTSAFFTNAAGVNIIANPLSLGAPGGRYFCIAPGSELRLMGTVTNTAASGTSVGWLNLTNGGTVRIMNSAKSTRGMDLFQGTVIVDGSAALADCGNDGFRLKPPTGSTIAVQITNNGTIRIGGGGNFRMGHNGTGIGGIAGSGSLSRVDLSSGTLELYGAAVSVYVGDLVSGATSVFNQNGGLVWGSAGAGNAIVLGNSAGADGTYNLNGGVLWIGQVKQGNASAANATFNFNGGTLKPSASSTTFFQGLLAANILGGGAIVDTTNLNITIGQSFAGSGGLTKLGSGVLTLAGSSSYTGATVVSSGALVLAPGALNGGGALTVADGATLNLTNTGGSLSVSTLTLGSAAASSLQFNFPSGNPGSAAIMAGTMTAGGSVAVTITGTGLTTGTFPLISFTSGSGLANFHLVSVPPGVSATLVATASSLSLNITSVGKSLAWSGAANANWDTTTVNWNDLGNGNTPTTYSQPGGFGDFVTFDDSAIGNPNVNLIQAVSPVAMTMNNSSYPYTFTGPGKITGIGSVTINGYQSVTFGTVNDYSGGTTFNAGPVYLGADQALGTGPATLNSGGFSSDSTTARTVSNVVVQNADLGVILGDTVNTGTLTLAGGLDLGNGATRTLDFNSDIIISGTLTNGGIATKTGPGAMIIKGNAVQNALASQLQGDVIVDGGAFTSANGWRLENSFSGSTIRLAVTNGGVVNVAVGGNTGNLRVGLTGGDNGANNIVDIAGTLNLAPTTAAVNGNNAVGLGQSGANDILYLRSGGLLITRSIFGSTPGNAEAHFMGGTIRAIANDTGFITGLTNAYMENGGLTVDTTNFNVTISQALLASGTGGLTKIGTGTLTLAGTNTYTGPTLVSAGKLVLAPAHAATGGITVNANSTLAFLQSSAPATVNVPSVTIGGGTNSALEIQMSVTNAPTAVITNLVLNGPTAVNVSGAFGIGQFPLFGYGTISGSGGLTLGSVPLGTIGTLTTNTVNKTIDLVVSAIAQVVWTGNLNGNWDLVTTNWTVSGTPTAYAQSANVLFDDSASNATVSLTTALTPGTMLISNTTLSYTFAGSGSLGGSMALVKDGTNVVALNTANSYSGATTLKAGRLNLGNATALGSGTGTVTIQNGATLNLNGNAVSASALQPVVVSGAGAIGTGAIVNSGADQANALRNVTLSGDTVIGGVGQIGLRTSADTDPGLVANGHKLIKTGSNTWNLNGGQTVAGLTNVWFTDIGNIDIQQGTLGFERRAALGNPTNTITIEAGATLSVFSLNSTLPVPTNQLVMTNGTLLGTGAVGDINTFGGQITLNGSSNAVNVTQWVNTTGQTSLNLNGPIVGSGGVQFSASNTVIQLAGNNTYAGNTVVASGTLSLTANNALAGSANVTIASNATLDVSSITPWTLGASQTLGGAGTVNGSLLANGTVAPGLPIGTLTVNGNLTVAGNVAVDVDKSLAQSNDTVVVNGTLNNTGAGTMTIVNSGTTALVVGDKFTLFNQPVSGGATLTITGAGATWTNTLAVDGSVTVLTVTPAGPTSPEPITVSTTGGSLNLQWPTIGWQLQVQTNSLTTGLSTNWSNWPGSKTTNAVSIPVVPGNPSVFFRLISQ